LAWRTRYGWCSSDDGDCTDASNSQYPDAPPEVGEYSQFDDDVLEYQLLGALATGLDGFIVNWDPASAFQTAVIGRVFAAAELLLTKHGMSVSLMISYDSKSSTQSELENEFTTLLQWTQSPCYFRDDVDVDNLDTPAAGKKPVVLLWSDGAVPEACAAARTVFSSDPPSGGVFLLARNAVNVMAITDGNFG
jgi:hypothetical protein